jgi:hypothetical protein
MRVKVISLVKKLGAVALNYLYIQEIDPRPALEHLKNPNGV